MAVIKGIVLIGCYDSGRILQVDASKETLLARIRRSREAGSTWYRDAYIGEKGVLDVNISKIECGSCRMELRLALRSGTERRVG